MVRGAFGTSWDYALGAHGPKHWTGKCHTGSYQSPIDLRVPSDQLVADTQNTTRIDYGISDLNELNTGHHLKLNTMGGSSLLFRGRVFNVRQFHYHTPSANNIAGHHYPAELQFVNHAKDGELTVLAVFVKK